MILLPVLATTQHRTFNPSLTSYYPHTLQHPPSLSFPHVVNLHTLQERPTVLMFPKHSPGHYVGCAEVQWSRLSRLVLRVPQHLCITHQDAPCHLTLLPPPSLSYPLETTSTHTIIAHLAYHQQPCQSVQAFGQPRTFREHRLTFFQTGDRQEPPALICYTGLGDLKKAFADPTGL